MGFVHTRLPSQLRTIAPDYNVDLPNIHEATNPSAALLTSRK